MTASYIGIVQSNPQVLSGEVVAAAGSGTLSGGQLVQIVFDDTTFSTNEEGKQRLLAAIDYIRKRLETAKVYPLTSAS